MVISNLTVIPNKMSFVTKACIYSPISENKCLNDNQLTNINGLSEPLFE